MAERLESHRRARPASALLLTVLLSFLIQGCGSDDEGAKPAADTSQDGSGDTSSADAADASSTDDTTDTADGSAADTVEQKILALQRDKAALANAVVQEESLASVLDLDSLRQILA